MDRQYEIQKLWGLSITHKNGWQQENCPVVRGDYGDLDYVRKEMKFALRLFSQNVKWPVIDVTDKPIEEIASEILTIKKQFK